jgi:hypothetical protein
VKGLTRIVAMAATLAALATGVPLAGADTTWTKISTDFQSSIEVPSLGLTGSTVVVVWTQTTATASVDLNATSFTTSPTQDVIGPATAKAAVGWGQLGDSHALFPAPGGGLQLWFNGIRAPLIGIFQTLRNADGSWAPPFQVATGGGSIWSGVLSGATPIVVTNGSGGINVYTGAVAHPNGADQNLESQLGGCCGYQPELAFDSGGHLWIAWYTRAGANIGMYVQQLDPATGAPIGAPAKAPSSETPSNNNNGGTDLACTVTCRLVYDNTPPTGQAGAIVSWWPGESTPTTIAKLAPLETGGNARTAVYRTDGRLWVAWYQGKTYRVTLGDATGAGGAVADIGTPAAAGTGPDALEGIAVGDNLLLASTFDWKPASDQAMPHAVFVNTIAPPAAVTPAPGPRDVQLQTAPGGKGFRIQVQYTMPTACTGAAACTLRGELRTRTGRRLYAVTPLPGDTKLVLGTRAKFGVPKGKKGKIRFYITVSKAQLLKAPFSTEGGSRVAETRLRVWYTAKGSKEALSVRDGRIKVSIARIKSGALPGLSGIL